MSRLRRTMLSTAVALLMVAAGGVVQSPSAAAAGSARMVALPSLGGSASLAQVNRHGQATGYAYDANANVVWGVWLHPDRFTPLNVGFAMAINDLGHVAGVADDMPGSGFLWTAGSVRHLTYPERLVWVTGLNNRDEVVGNLHMTDAVGAAAFRWRAGVFTALPTPDGWLSYATAINDLGAVLGYLVDPASQTMRAVVWRGGVMTDLGTLGGTFTTPLDINIRGQVIGYSRLTDPSVQHPFLYSAGVLTDLLAGEPPGSTGTAQALNNRGMVAGGTDDRGVVWWHGRKRIVTVDGYSAVAQSLNERGDVAGSIRQPDAESQDRDVFRWRNGRMEYIDVPDDAIMYAVAGIDDSGRVFANLERRDGPDLPVYWLPR